MSAAEVITCLGLRLCTGQSRRRGRVVEVSGDLTRCDNPRQLIHDLGPGLLLRPPYRFLVRRAGPQKDAALPLALERVVYAHAHAADLLQFDFAKLAVLE